MDATLYLGKGNHHTTSALPRRILLLILSVSWGFLFLILIALVAVIPVDAIVQLKNSVYIFNIFVIVSVCAFFIVVTLSIYFSRLFQFRAAIEDIPKHYIPITEQDLGDKVFHSIKESLERTRAALVSLGPKDIHLINHPGLSPPAYTDDTLSRNEKHDPHDFALDPDIHDAMSTLPPNLVYEDVLRSIGDKIKFGDHHFFNLEMAIPAYFSFREIFYFLGESHFHDHPQQARVEELIDELVDLYEHLRFSGQPIRLDQFVDFMALLIMFLRYISVAQNNESDDDDDYPNYDPLSVATTTGIPSISGYSISDKAPSSWQPQSRTNLAGYQSSVSAMRLPRKSFGNRSDLSFDLHDFLNHPRGSFTGNLMDVNTIPKLFVGSQADETGSGVYQVARRNSPATGEQSEVFRRSKGARSVCLDLIDDRSSGDDSVYKFRGKASNHKRPPSVARHESDSSGLSVRRYSPAKGRTNPFESSNSNGYYSQSSTNYDIPYYSRRYSGSSSDRLVVVKPRAESQWEVRPREGSASSSVRISELVIPLHQTVSYPESSNSRSYDGDTLENDSAYHSAPRLPAQDDRQPDSRSASPQRKRDRLRGIADFRRSQYRNSRDFSDGTEDVGIGSTDEETASPSAERMKRKIKRVWGKTREDYLFPSATNLSSLRFKSVREEER
ncbi:hypothetical protein BABINDRAFT_8754 [Babjeviella inositovora NRRL Y-12698]|uniref:Defect at low temperature protein 1 n=1 Tax=Babjeviella inositovora NRRL Y-12698 TaxID=984486 RepID=A0A1E3QNA9_9ASCO|nr:uncharacterized protein BABINDRAFT_8754 [Babjeviella inositovora NRRL Y-12698]ODQ79161.1 hypothetical protein BABINDRAFT_8754 [Babjeviella inositovora NRRL Y-12698]